MPRVSIVVVIVEYISVILLLNIHLYYGYAIKSHTLDAFARCGPLYISVVD